MVVDVAVLWLWILMCLAMCVMMICVLRLAETALARKRLADLQARIARLEEAVDGMKGANASKALESLSGIDGLKEQCDESTKRWMAMAERLDAQGARILELEHRVSLCDTVVPEQ